MREEIEFSNLVYACTRIVEDILLGHKDETITGDLITVIKDEIKKDNNEHSKEKYELICKKCDYHL